MVTDTHEAVLARAADGDADALEALLERHYPALLAYVRLHTDRMIRQHESCADIVQSVCREALEDGALGGFEYRGEPAFRKWLFQRAVHKLVDRKKYYLAQKRAPNREVRISQPDSSNALEGLYATICSPSQQAMAREDIARLESAFERLPAQYRLVITLSRLFGMSHAEIAEEMGRSEGAVRVLLHRAITRLGLLMTQD